MKLSATFGDSDEFSALNLLNLSIYEEVVATAEEYFDGMTDSIMKKKSNEFLEFCFITKNFQTLSMIKEKYHKFFPDEKAKRERLFHLWDISYENDIGYRDMVVDMNGADDWKIRELNFILKFAKKGKTVRLLVPYRDAFIEGIVNNTKDKATRITSFCSFIESYDK